MVHLSLDKKKSRKERTESEWELDVFLLLSMTSPYKRQDFLWAMMMEFFSRLSQMPASSGILQSMKNKNSSENVQRRPFSVSPCLYFDSRQLKGTREIKKIACWEEENNKKMIRNIKPLEELEL